MMRSSAVTTRWIDTVVQSETLRGVSSRYAAAGGVVVIPCLRIALAVQL